MYLTLPFLSKIGTVQWSLISLWYTAEYSDELKQKGTLAETELILLILQTDGASCEDLKNIQVLLVALVALGALAAFMSAIASYVSCCSFCSQEEVCYYWF